MITAVHLGCARLQSQSIQGEEREVSSVKTRVWTDIRAFNRSYSDDLNRVERGDQQGEEMPAQHWFWYIGFGCGWRVSQG